MRWTLPNAITLARICITPVIALLPFFQGSGPKLAAFIIYLIAAFSDTVDGYLARRRNEISELGQLLDPIADKLLLFATLVPIYWLTNHPPPGADYALWGWNRGLPLWVVLILLGREALITGFRMYAMRRGTVIPAAGAGKLKATMQAIFIGAGLAWFAWKDLLAEHGWTGWFPPAWDLFHGAFMLVTLSVAVVLTVYSLVVYLYRYRALLKSAA